MSNQGREPGPSVSLPVLGAGFGGTVLLAVTEQREAER